MARLVHLWLLLFWKLLRVTVCNVSSLSQCGTNEFLSENLCCQLCSAGSYFHKPCQMNHGPSECIPCEPNLFMKHNNKEPSCLPCSECGKDQEEVATCTQQTDRVCHCKQGTYCNSENCVENCRSCSSCPNGRVIRQCNATMDTLCHTFDSESGMADYQCACLYSPLNIIVVTAAIIIIIAAVISIAAVIIWWFYKRSQARCPRERRPRGRRWPGPHGHEETGV